MAIGTNTKRTHAVSSRRDASKTGCVRSLHALIAYKEFRPDKDHKIDCNSARTEDQPARSRIVDMSRQEYAES